MLQEIKIPECQMPGAVLILITHAGEEISCPINQKCIMLDVTEEIKFYPVDATGYKGSPIIIPAPAPAPAPKHVNTKIDISAYIKSDVISKGEGDDDDA